MSSVRTRFAPSPTGHLHLGSARTALFAWLYAHKHKGVFVLRIEDTDQERSTPESVASILEAMDWLGLDYQEGPYYQTERFERYHAIAQSLLEQGHAYRCVCSKERLEALRTSQQAQQQKPRYDGRCRDLNLSQTNEPHVIRFRNPLTGSVSFDDQIRGRLTFENQELDDLIIVRSDGCPTYNFTVVVDDWDMHITHVIRGDDHINNTPRQINILSALGASLPAYAHVSTILGPDGKRLSKRHGAMGILEYRESGFLPDALINMLLRLGWSHGDQEVFSREEMIRWFDFSAISRSAAAFNPEKLLWLNQHYLKTSPPETILPELKWHMQRIDISHHSGPNLIDLIRAQSERCKTLHELVEKSRFFYEPVSYSPEIRTKHLRSETLPIFQALLDSLATVNEWTQPALHECVQNVARTLNVSLGQVAQPLRVALTGGTVSPPIDTTLFLLGQTETMSRLQQALEQAQSAQHP